MNRVLRSVAVLTTLLAFSVAVEAAPSVSGVSGTVATGQTIRVNGSGFGSKVPAAPHVWADFENGMTPTNLGRQTSWNGVAALSWTTTEGYKGTKGLKATDGNGVWTVRTDYTNWTRESQKSYIFRRQKMNFLITDPTQNWKVWRIWPASANGNYPNIYAGANNGLCNVEMAGNQSGFWGNFNHKSTDWVAEEFLFQASSAIDTKDGLVVYRANGVEKTRGAVRTRTSSSPAYMVANYVVHAVLANKSTWTPAWNSNNRVWVDDVYVDTTWSRVMIGNAATYSSCTNFEVQIPSAWADGSVTVTAITRSFASGTRAYVYVFDSNNSVNANGFPITINSGSVAQNQAPTVNLGANLVIPFGQILTTLNPTANDDGLPNPPARLTYSWSQILGPAAAQITNLTSLIPGAITFPAIGQYVLRLTASDSALSGSDDITIDVQPVNQAPTVNAGGDATVIAGFPLQLSGMVTDDGYPAPPGLTTVLWTHRTGPATPTITEPTALSTTVRFPVAGTYTLRLAANDSTLTAFDELTVTVAPAAGNGSPVANAGSDLTITLPAQANLAGSGTDDGLPVGSVLTYAWSKTAGPGVVGFADITRPDTSASFSQDGSYTLQLTVSDGELSHSDTVVIDVQPEPPGYVDGSPLISSVNGRLQPGGSLTINGSRFGDKYPVAPYVWADFESSAAPNPVSVRSSWDQIENMEWSTEGFNGSRGMKASNGGGIWTMRADFDSWSRDSQKLYVFKKQKMNFKVTNDSQSWKMWRMWPNNHGYPNVYASAHNGRVYVENIGTESGFWGSFRTNSTSWVTDELIFQASSAPGVKDGLLVIRQNGNEKARGSLITRSAAAPEFMGVNYVVHGVAASRGSWSPSWNDGNRLWVDDVYVDTTWSRVMIGDASTYASCNNLEVQIPTAWSANSITVASRPGAFNKGARVYLYVFDKFNRVNETGYPLAIDGTGIGTLADGGTGGTSGDEPVRNVFNPAKGENASLAYVLNDRGSIRVQIFDRAGRRVKNLVGDECLSGTHTIAWDGKNEQNSTVASGVYIAVLKGTDGTHSRQKVAVVK
jgi:hypothetical protein